MKLLVIGGGRLIGRSAALEALARGHEVTLFNRGQADPDGLIGAEHIQGDREKDLGRLAGRRWDAVLDTCGYVPRIVGESVNALGDHVGRYLFISSVSVFEHNNPGVDENGPLKTMSDEAADTYAVEYYGPLKARCERVVRDALGERALIVRPGLVVGPGDYADRFTYWVDRIARGGTIVTVDRAEMPVEWIDARDMGGWMVRMLEAGGSGDYNATGPADGPIALGDFLTRIAKAVGSTPEFAWVDVETLERLEIEPWTDLPFVLPYDGSEDGIARTNVKKAQAAGLRYRPLEESARDVLAWWRAIDPPRPLKAGLTPDREAQVLEAFARR